MKGNPVENSELQGMNRLSTKSVHKAVDNLITKMKYQHGAGKFPAVSPDCPNFRQVIFRFLFNKLKKYYRLVATGPGYGRIVSPDGAATWQYYPQSTGDGHAAPRRAGSRDSGKPSITKSL